LKNAIERAKVLADGDTIRAIDLPSEVTSSPPIERGLATDTEDHDELAALERNHVLKVLRREGGNKTRAARRLGVDRRTLYRMLERIQKEQNAELVSTGTVPTCVPD
jgi:DNA-binding NtrC family response regulator